MIHFSSVYLNGSPDGTNDPIQAATYSHSQSVGPAISASGDPLAGMQIDFDVPITSLKFWFGNDDVRGSQSGDIAMLDFGLVCMKAVRRRCRARG